MPSTGLTEVFITLLKKHPQNPGFTVKETLDNKQIIVIPNNQADSSTLLAEIEEVFKSQASTTACIPFNLNLTTLDSQNAINIPAINSSLLTLSEIYSLGVTKILERIFGIEKLKSIGCQSQWEEVKTNSKQTIYRTFCSGRDIKLRTYQIETYKHILSHASWEDLYLALAKTNHNCLRDYEETEEYGKSPLTPYLEQLFFIREEHGKTFIYFDCIGLIQCILAPKFTLTDQQTVAGYSGIVVDKSHFMLYMSTILKQNQGILFHKHQEQQILPISIEHLNVIQSKTLIYFGINCSGSMGEVFTELKELLKKLITKLHNCGDLDNNLTEVRLSRFGSNNKYFPIISSNLAELPKLKDAIEAFDHPVEYEQTALYKFLCTQYDSYKGLKDYNIISILITDGKDNNSQDQYKPNCYKTDELSKALHSIDKDINPPQFFSLEIGNDIDENILETIRQATCGKRIKIGGNLENFALIMEYVGKLALYRRFIHFAQGARSFKLPVIEGDITIANHNDYLEPNALFTMNGVPMTISHNNRKDMAVASTETQTEEGLSLQSDIHPTLVEEKKPGLIFSHNESKLPIPDPIPVDHKK